MPNKEVTPTNTPTMSESLEHDHTQPAVDAIQVISPLWQQMLDTLLPGDAELGMPSAFSAGVAQFLLRQGHKSLFDEFLAAIETIAIQKHQTTWLSLDTNKRLECIERSRRSHFQLASQFLSQVLRGYYTTPAVQISLNAGVVPPFPQGNQLAEINWDLLEPVYERGPIYREVKMAQRPFKTP